jgi:SnoaL-like domain
LSAIPWMFETLRALTRKREGAPLPGALFLYGVALSQTASGSEAHIQSYKLRAATFPGDEKRAPSSANQNQMTMSHSISTLLIRNLQDVFGENDPVRRRAAIDELFTEDCVFYDPSKGVYRGRDEIDRIAGAIKATHPDFRYQPIAEPEESGNGGRVPWVSGRPGDAPAYAGTDFIIARDGRIAALYLFFDKLP